ncbi:DUF6783 domain-containing protein [Anaerobutyricum hallii]
MSILCNRKYTVNCDAHLVESIFQTRSKTWLWKVHF